jgi:uncharacterized protein GlcG (DUF336 family)
MMEELTKKDIMTMLDAATAKCDELGVALSSIAIMDSGGNLAGFIRPSGTRIGTVSLAINKAWTAIAMMRPSAQVMPLVQPGAVAYGMNITESRICPIEGALPITRDGKTYLGGIGASGGTSKMDLALCEAALEAAGFQTKFGEFSFSRK